jgi:AcrR family transcriptional regulator
LAAVNYHFQSKDELVRAVYARRLGPMNAQRLEALDALEAQHAPHAVPLDQLIDAFYEPLVRNAQLLREMGVNVAQMMGRIYTEPHQVVDQIWNKELCHVAARFSAAYLRTLPHLSKREVYWRMHLSIGVLSHAMGAGRKLNQLSEGICDGGNMQELLVHIKSFAQAGFSAPSSGAQ